jgi:uncharacterized protein YdbL (DUF1318 family)
MMMTSRPTRFPKVFLLLSCALLGACVTVNIYFPAEAIEKAADRFVKDIYQQKQQQKPADDSKTAPKPDNAKPQPSSELELPMPGAGHPVADAILDLLVPSAYAAQPNIEVSSPAIEQLKHAMQARYSQLVPFYNSGAVGLSANGLIVLRDPKAVSLKDRNTVTQLVAAENRDRNTLYDEIAKVNGHPEWAPQIRSIFDKRWVANAPAGWWFQNADGNWMKK